MVGILSRILETSFFWSDRVRRLPKSEDLPGFTSFRHRYKVALIGAPLHQDLVGSFSESQGLLNGCIETLHPLNLQKAQIKQTEVPDCSEKKRLYERQSRQILHSFGVTQLARASEPGGRSASNKRRPIRNTSSSATE